VCRIAIERLAALASPLHLIAAVFDVIGVERPQLFSSRQGS
jgi:hypothetical protein